MSTVEEICSRIKSTDSHIVDLQNRRRQLINELNEALKDMLPSGLYVEEMRDD